MHRVSPAGARFTLAPALLGLLVLAGCTTAPVSPPTSSPPPPPTLGPLGASGCLPVSPIVEGVFPEVQGTPTKGDATTLYGWIMADRSLPLHIGSDIKIVWRMPGEGDATARLIAPDGTDRPLVFGPEEHGGSNYDRPGREWGTGVNFDAVGCWELRLATDTTAAAVWFEPAP